MNVIVFVNRIATPDFNTKLVGHVGWGFKLANGNFMYGSKEAKPSEFMNQIPFFPGVIHKGNPNGVFVKEATCKDMLGSLRAGGNEKGPRFLYHQYKLLQAPDVSIDDAVSLAWDSKNWGYGLPGNNCMDDVFKIIKAYASGDDTFLPWPSTHWLPNAFFDAIKAEVHVINDH